MCALSRFTSRFSENPLSLTEEQRSIRAENISEVKPMRAPPGLSDPNGEDVKKRDSRHELHGCQRKLLG